MKIERFVLALALLLAAQSWASAQDINYVVQVREPGERFYHVETELPATGGETLVSLPRWTPGHYVFENYSRFVHSFDATTLDGTPLRWDKVDHSTWRIQSAGNDRVRLSFDFQADTLSLSASLLKDDFGFFNGTNLFVYPETGLDFTSSVRIDLPDGWDVVTELEDGDAPFTYTASSYDELVDNPTFVGAFAVDSVVADDRTIRLAVYPASFMRDPARELSLNALQQIADYSNDLFGGPPYDRYTTLIYLETEPINWAGGLEHADSHLDVLPAIAFENAEVLMPMFGYRLLAHEFYHLWNVKRIRPSDLWPYAYDVDQPTPLLWVSEGFTDYYAYLILVRTGLWDEDSFWGGLADAISAYVNEPHVALEDASLSVWVDPIETPGNYYYDKGGLIGLLFDIEIRGATNNQHSLDEVMLRLYQDHYERDRGFTTDDILTYVAEYIGEDKTRDLYRRYVDGFEVLPLEETLAIAGVAYEAVEVTEPFLGIALGAGEEGPTVQLVVPGSPADEAGLREGDLLFQVGDVQIISSDWTQQFSEQYQGAAGQMIPLQVRRGGQDMTLEVRVTTRTRTENRVSALENVTEEQKMIRDGILTGTVASE